MIRLLKKYVQLAISKIFLIKFIFNKIYLLINNIMGLIKINHKNPDIAFLFNSMHTAIIFAAVLVFNDYIDKKYDLVNTTKDHIIKKGIHIISIFIFYLILTYLFKFLFGWGNSLIG